MSVAAETERKPFVLLPLGSRRLAVRAESVVELIAPGKVQNFPHQTPWISGVIVRRGRVVPICNLGSLLGEKRSQLDRFYLIAEWRASGLRDWCAIPVTGECELTQAEEFPAGDGRRGNRPEYLAGALRVAEEAIDILDLGALLGSHEPPARESAAEPKR